MGARIWVGTRKGVFCVAKKGGKWRIASRHFVGENVPIVHRDPRDGAIYATLSHGHFGNHLHRSDDDGKTWTEIAAPAYPEQPTDLAPHPLSGKVIDWKLELIWSIAHGGADEPGVLWCGTVPGGLFRSADRGETWTLNHGLWNVPTRGDWFGGGFMAPGIHSICVDPRNSKHVLVAISSGGVWRTEDGGETWTHCSKGMRAPYSPPEQQEEPASQDPHIMVRCPSAPDCLWIQHHAGIWRSTDNAASWQEVTAKAPSHFGFATAVHPKDPKVAWFVPAEADMSRAPTDARVVVTQTKNGGKSLKVLKKGLPQSDAYDLVYRHALDVDATGKILAFGSTTGGFWVTENGGSSWQHTDARFPPIYCVRVV